MKLQIKIATATFLAVLISAAIYEFEERPGVDMQMGGYPVTWWWVRWEIGIPLSANLGIAVLCMCTVRRRRLSETDGQSAAAGHMGGTE